MRRLKNLDKKNRLLGTIILFFMLFICTLTFASLARSKDGKTLKQSDDRSVTENESKPILDPHDPRSLLYLNRAGKLAGTGDPRKPAGESYKWGMGWQPKAFEYKGLPKDKYGLVNWIKLATDGFILPKGSLNPNSPEYETPVIFKYNEEDEDSIEDILIITKSDFIADVRFPHTLHAWWLSCKSCHPRRFEKSAGGNAITMKEMANGKWCGECHSKVAFPLTDCKRCHNLEKGKADTLCGEDETLSCPEPDAGADEEDVSESE